MSEDGQTAVATTTTGSDGNYSFDGFIAGKHLVRFAPTPGKEFVTQDVGDDAADSDVDETGTTAPVRIVEDVLTVNVDAGVSVPPGAVLGRYFCDENRDDTESDGGGGIEVGVTGKTVTLFKADDTLVARVTTGSDGSYRFDALQAGDYYLEFESSLSEGKGFVVPDVGDDDTDSDVVDPQSGRTGIFTVVAGKETQDLDAGVADLPGSISGRYFCDTDNDALDNNNGDEPGLNRILVTLLDAAGNVLTTTLTSAVGGVEGAYRFTELLPGEYSIQFSDPNGVNVGKTLVAPNVGGDDASDSDAIGDATVSIISNIHVVANQDNSDNDAGVAEERLAPVLSFEEPGLPTFGTESALNTVDRSSFQNSVDIAALPDGGYVATWASGVLDINSFSDIKAQIFNADGTARGPEFLVNATVDDPQSTPEVAALSDGSFWITFTSPNFDPVSPGGRGINVRRFDADHNPIDTTDLLVNTLIEGSQTSPDIAALDDDRIVVTWSDFNADDDFVYQRIYDSDGTALTEQLLVNATEDKQFSGARVTALEGGSHVVAYSSFERLPDDPSGTSGGFVRQALAQIYDDGGALTATLVSDVSNGALSFDADGGFSYTPNADFFGMDSFVYRANDDLEVSNDAIVEIEVAPALVRLPPPGELDTRLPVQLYTYAEDDGTLVTSFGQTERDAAKTVLAQTGIELVFLPEIVVPSSSFKNGGSGLIFEFSDFVRASDAPPPDMHVGIIAAETATGGPALALIGAVSRADGERVGVALIEEAAGSTITELTLGTIFARDVGFALGLETVPFDPTDPLSANNLMSATRVPSSPALAILTDFQVGTARGSELVGGIGLPTFDNATQVGVADEFVFVSGSELSDNDLDGDGGALRALLVRDMEQGVLSFAQDGSLTYAPDPGATGTDSFIYIADDFERSSELTLVQIDL